MKPKGMVMFHGAGGNKDHRVLKLIEDTVEIPVLRKNFDYRNIGDRRPPPGIPKLVDEVNQACVAFANELGISTLSLIHI